MNNMVLSGSNHPGRNFRRFPFIYKGLLILVLLLILSAGVLKAGNEGFYSTPRQHVIDTFFSEETVHQMKQDAGEVRKHYPGVNPFSSAQYGIYFVQGVTDLGDIFDARNPVNMRIFKDYARKNHLIANVESDEHYDRYSIAAYRFLKETQFDTVLFYPDEYHPVFTRHDDTWLFILQAPPKKEEPDKTAPQKPDKKAKKEEKGFASKRVGHRTLKITGGMEMTPIDLEGFRYFYIPQRETPYQRYEYIAHSPVSDDNPSISMVPASPEALKLRQEMGIIASPLSGRKNLSVGCWISKKEYMESALKNGIWCEGKEDIYTWSGMGLYLIPLDREFWE